MRLVMLVAFCAALPMAVSAQSYLALNRLAVVPINAADFEVIEANGEGARGIWCAAASFAQDRLGVPGSHRIYVKTPRGPSVSGVGRAGVVFTTQSDAPDRQSYSVTVLRAGENLPVNHALMFCMDYLIELNDL